MMKRIILFLAIISLGYSLFAQEVPRINDSSLTQFIGAKAGLTLSSLVGKNTEDLKTVPGLAGGLFIQTNDAKKITFQPEMMFTQKGYKEKSGSSSATVTLKYIQANFLFKHDLRDSNFRNTYVYLGPCIGYNTSSTLKFTIDGQTGTFDVTDAVYRIEWSACGGVIFDFANDYLVDFRYSRGFTKVLKSDLDLYNSQFTIMIGKKIAHKF